VGTSTGLDLSPFPPEGLDTRTKSDASAESADRSPGRLGSSDPGLAPVCFDWRRRHEMDARSATASAFLAWTETGFTAPSLPVGPVDP
jgi:hypothetical protein